MLKRDIETYLANWKKFEWLTILLYMEFFVEDKIADVIIPDVDLRL